MMLKKILFSFLLIGNMAAYAQTKSITKETAGQKAARMKWFTDARFGMFIHWGLYALPGRHEWVKQRERLTTEQYEKYFNNFDPDQFDPRKWAKEAKAAGMKYAVLTTKHHEGFCLFDSKYTDYKSTNTAAKRDLVKEFVEAFRAEGLKVGFYYSLIDWHHPDFTIDRIHPQREMNKNEWSEKEKRDTAYYQNLNKGKDMSRYRKYLKDQVTELLTNYGKIDILWMDFSYPGAQGKGRNDWASADLLKTVKKLQPNIIINNRLDLNDYTDGFDFETPEQVKPQELLKYKGKYWETCQTFSGSWGYYRDEHSWKTQRQLLDLLVTSVANGGNLILNVGPTARGEFDYRANKALDSLSYWMHANSRSIYNCTYPPEELALPAATNTRLTYNPNTGKLYVHLFNYPTDGKLVLPGYKGKVKYAQLLNDASEVQFTTAGSDIELKLPGEKPPYEVPVIELITK
jgi:alpha-L-fucosidase